MRQSVLLHVAGPESKDVGIYLAQAETIRDPITRWDKIGLVQELYLRCTSEDLVPRIIVSNVGVNITTCEKPDLSQGLVIMLQGFFGFGTQGCFQTSDVAVLVPALSWEVKPGSRLLDSHTILGRIQELTLSVSCIDNNVICYINGLNFSGVSIPSWVTIGALPPELIR